MELTVLRVPACLLCDVLAGSFGDDFGIVAFVTLQAYLLANLKVCEKRKKVIMIGQIEKIK